MSHFLMPSLSSTFILSKLYTSLALPPLGSTDHNSVLLAPVYKPVIQRVQRVVKTVKDWTEDSVACLQGCFGCTD